MAVTTPEDVVQPIIEISTEPSDYPHRKCLADLTEKTCKWPVGDPLSSGFFFCGAEHENHRYCTEHMAMAYVPHRKRGTPYQTKRRVPGMRASSPEYVV